MEFTCIITTLDCNWDCPYCCSFIHNDLRPRSDKDIFDVIKKMKIAHKQRIDISGGEPGLKTRYFFDQLFTMLQSSINFIYTNGLFIDKYYHIYFDHFKSCYLHVVKELDEDIKPKTLRYCLYEKVIPLIVVHNKNINLVSDFLERYPDINFTLVPCVNLVNDYNLSKDDLKRLISELQHHNNYKSTINLTREYLGTQLNKRVKVYGAYNERIN